MYKLKDRDTYVEYFYNGSSETHKLPSVLNHPNQYFTNTD